MILLLFLSPQGCEDTSLFRGEMTQGELTGLADRGSVNGFRGDDSMSLLDNTVKFKSGKLMDLAKKTLPTADLDTFVSSKVPTQQNENSFLNDSENSTVRRSLRISRLSTETPLGKENTPAFKTPQISFNQSSSKKKSTRSSTKQKKNVSLISRNNDSTAALTFSEISEIALVDKSLDGSNSSLQLDLTSRQEDKIAALHKRRDEMRSQLEEAQSRNEEEKEIVELLEEELRVEQKRRPHPFSLKLMELAGLNSV